MTADILVMTLPWPERWQEAFGEKPRGSPRGGSRCLAHGGSLGKLLGTKRDFDGKSELTYYLDCGHVKT